MVAAIMQLATIVFPEQQTPKIQWAQGTRQAEGALAPAPLLANRSPPESIRMFFFVVFVAADVVVVFSFRISRQPDVNLVC